MHRVNKKIHEACRRIVVSGNSDPDDAAQTDALLPQLYEILDATEALIMQPVGKNDAAETVVLKFFLAVRLRNRLRAEDLLGKLIQKYPDSDFNEQKLRRLLEDLPRSA